MLATSREPLHVAGEQVYRVPSLGVPEAVAEDIRDVADTESVRLFMERATRHRPDFLLDSGNASAIASICRRLDGIPLAIEIAAARLRSLSPAEIDARLDDRFRIVRSPARDVPLRQQTLEALIDWSWDLLTESERHVLARLSVFAGNFDLPAAEAVAPDDLVDAMDVCDLLTSLVEKSLVQAEEGTDATRYRLLETIRDYSRGKLLAAGGEGDARGAHLEYFVGLAETARPRLRSADVRYWRDRLDQERDNLRAAIVASLGAPDPTSGLRLIVAMGWYWASCGYAREIFDAGTSVLEITGAKAPSALCAGALNELAAIAAVFVGDLTASRRLAEEALQVGRIVGDDEAVCEALSTLARVHEKRAEAHAALGLVEDALALARRLDNQTLIADLLKSRAGTRCDLCDLERARDDFSESLRLFQQLGDLTGVGSATCDLGYVALCRGDLMAGRAHFAESLAIARDLGHAALEANVEFNLALIDHLEGNSDEARCAFYENLAASRRLGDPVAVCYALFGVALTETELGDPVRSAVLHGAVDEGFQGLGHAFVEQAEVRLRDADRARLEDALGKAAFERAYRHGRSMSLNRAADLVGEPTGTADPEVTLR